MGKVEESSLSLKIGFVISLNLNFWWMLFMSVLVQEFNFVKKVILPYLNCGSRGNSLCFSDLHLHPLFRRLSVGLEISGHPLKFCL